MTVQSQTAKSGPYAGAGTKGPFPVDFRFLENGHLRVIKTDAAGVEQTLVIGPDYSVAGAGNQAGGSVTLSADLLAGYTLVVLRKVPATQLADYVEGDSFPAESHENALDKLTMIAQQLTEEVSRAAKLPVTSAADAQQLTNNIMRLANSADNIDTVAGNVGSVNAAADNMPAIIDAPAQAQAAAESATAADQSAQDAAASYDAFDDRYLGAKSTDPTTDNDGNPLLIGALYWSTASNAMRVYSGTAWVDVAQGVSFPYQVLSGTGSQTAFTLNSAPGSLGALEVFIAGVRQYPVTNYTLSGVTLTFVTAPPAGTNNIFARWVTTQAINVPSYGTVSKDSLSEELRTELDEKASSLWVRKNSMIAGQHKNLRCSATGKNSLVSVSADQLVIEDAAGEAIKLRGVNLSIDSAISGVNGLDTGVLTANTWYSVFVISDGVNVRGLASLSATAPELPTGYTKKTKVWDFFTDATASKFPLASYKNGRVTLYKPTAASNLTSLRLASSGVVGTWTSGLSVMYAEVSLAAFVPEGAVKACVGALSSYNNGGLSNVVIAPSASYSGTRTATPPPISTVINGGTGNVLDIACGDISLETRSIFVVSQSAGGAVVVYGWEDSL